MAFLEGLCLTMLCQNIFFNFMVFCIYIMVFSFVFIWAFLCVNVYMSMSTHVSCAFSFALFLRFFLSYSYFYFMLFFRCLFVFLSKQGRRSVDLGGRELRKMSGDGG